MKETLIVSEFSPVWVSLWDLQMFTLFYLTGGLHAVDVSNPLNPTFAGCFAEDGYTHDAQCVIYNGPDARYF